MTDYTTTIETEDRRATFQELVEALRGADALVRAVEEDRVLFAILRDAEDVSGEIEHYSGMISGRADDLECISGAAALVLGDAIEKALEWLDQEGRTPAVAVEVRIY